MILLVENKTSVNLFYRNFIDFSEFSVLGLYKMFVKC